MVYYFVTYIIIHTNSNYLLTYFNHISALFLWCFLKTQSTIINTTLARDDRRELTLSGNEEFSYDALGLCFEFPSPYSPLRINRGEVIGFQSTDLKVFCKIYYLFIVDKFEQQ